MSLSPRPDGDVVAFFVPVDDGLVVVAIDVIELLLRSAHSQKYNAPAAHANRNAPVLTMRKTRREGGWRDNAVTNAK